MIIKIIFVVERSPFQTRELFILLILIYLSLHKCDLDIKGEFTNIDVIGLFLGPLGPLVLALYVYKVFHANKMFLTSDSSGPCATCSLVCLIETRKGQNFFSNLH